VCVWLCGSSDPPPRGSLPGFTPLPVLGCIWLRHCQPMLACGGCGVSVRPEGGGCHVTVWCPNPHAPPPLSRLMQLTQDMHGELRHQNNLLSRMETDMGDTTNSLQSSLKKLGTLVSNGGSIHMCHLVAFCVVVFVMLYWMFLRK
jgi:hypothetical protein